MMAYKWQNTYIAPQFPFSTEDTDMSKGEEKKNPDKGSKVMCSSHLEMVRLLQSKNFFQLSELLNVCITYEDTKAYS